MTRVRGGALRTAVEAALLSATLCLLSPIALPLGPVPLTLGVFAVALCGCLLPPLWASATVLLYLGIGAIGLPVFAGGVGGPAGLLGPTGGFLLAYPLVAWLLSLTTARASRAGHTVRALLWALLPLTVLYAVGGAWYTVLTDVPPLASLMVLLPFLLTDIVKIVLAERLSVRLRPFL